MSQIFAIMEKPDDLVRKYHLRSIFKFLGDINQTEQQSFDLIDIVLT